MKLDSKQFTKKQIEKYFNEDLDINLRIENFDYEEASFVYSLFEDYSKVFRPSLIMQEKASKVFKRLIEFV